MNMDVRVCVSSSAPYHLVGSRGGETQESVVDWVGSPEEVQDQDRQVGDFLTSTNLRFFELTLGLCDWTTFK